MIRSLPVSVLAVAAALMIAGQAVAMPAGRHARLVTHRACRIPLPGPSAWDRPTLSNPTTLELSDANHALALSQSKDYIVHCPPGPLALSGALPGRRADRRQLRAGGDVGRDGVDENTSVPALAGEQPSAPTRLRADGA